jgi:hypothetical protein
MAGRPKGGQISEADFSTLLGALSSTAKGRAFLAEYRRRARPNETLSLLDSLQRIEATIGTVRDQLQPERIADELRRIAMTLEIAIEGASTDLAGEEGARRIALIERGRSELTSVAESLAGGPLAGHEVYPADSVDPDAERRGPGHRAATARSVRRPRPCRTGAVSSNGDAQHVIGDISAGQHDDDRAPRGFKLSRKQRRQADRAARLEYQPQFVESEADA